MMIDEYKTVVSQSRFRACAPYLLMDSAGYQLKSPEILQGAVTYEYLSPIPAHVPTLYLGVFTDWFSPEEDEAWKDL